MECYFLQRWTMASATSGALVWALIAALAGARYVRLGIIELLFLFAPLVVVPLGLELIDPGDRERKWMETAQTVQPFAAASAVCSFLFVPGVTAATLALPWTAVAALVSLAGVMSLRRWRSLSFPDFVIAISQVDLIIAAAWFLVSRLGLRPIGIQEPIILLTAVHFHYTGFATALIGALALKSRSKSSRFGEMTVGAVVLVPFIVAAGFVFSPLLKVVAVCVLVIAMLGLIIVLVRCARELESSVARAYLRVAATSIAFGMMLAAVYAVGEYTAKNWLIVPFMANTHGVINAIGFVMPALIAFSIERHRDV